jgi:hypothetical protein
VLPDPKLTPGDTLPAVTIADICTPGWATEHRHVTESMRDQVYEEYRRIRGPDCCEVDHLIPLELGGSNNMKNLWPQPDGTPARIGRKGPARERASRGSVRRQVAGGRREHCIASNWVECWEMHVGPDTDRNGRKTATGGNHRQFYEGSPPSVNE